MILKSIEFRAQPNLLLAALLRLDLASSPNTAALILRKSSKRRAMHKVHKVRVRLWKILGAQGVQEIAPFQLKAKNKNHQKTRTCTFQRKQVEIVSSAKVDTLWTPWTRLARPGKPRKACVSCSFCSLCSFSFCSSRFMFCPPKPSPKALMALMCIDGVDYSLSNLGSAILPSMCLALDKTEKCDRLSI